jgi:hypothetical protein
MCTRRRRKFVRGRCELEIARVYLGSLGHSWKRDLPRYIENRNLLRGKNSYLSTASSSAPLITPSIHLQSKAIIPRRQLLPFSILFMTEPLPAPWGHSHGLEAEMEAHEVYK